MQLKKTIGIIAALACTWGAAAEEPLELTLAEAIARAQQHSPEAQSARHTLISEGGIDVSVAHDEFTRLYRRKDKVVDMVAPRSCEQLRFRIRGNDESLVEQYPAYAFGKRRAARLAGEHRVDALSVKIFREQSELSGLTHSLATLEGNESAFHFFLRRIRGSAIRASRRLIILTQERRLFQVRRAINRRARLIRVKYLFFRG